MSTLKVNDIEEATSGGGKIFPARAWIKFSMVTPAIEGDKGVSSLLDRAVGDFDITLDNSMSNANYSLAGYTNALNGNSNFSSQINLGLGVNYSSSTLAVSTTGFSFNSYSTASVDASRNFAQVFGDLA